MKKTNIIILACLVFNSFLFSQNIPKSRDLLETDKYQRRDLSMPMSRIVINFFDFNSKLSPSEYSNRNTLPINAAYLSTDKNIQGHKPETRFSRAISDLLTIYKTSEGIDAVIRKPDLWGASLFSTEWMPHALPFKAQYKDNSSLKGVDFLYDEKTIVRQLYFSGNADGYVFAGNFDGTIRFVNNVVLVDNNNLKYAITFSEPLSNFVIKGQKWFLSLNDSNLIKELIVSVAFADKNETIDTLIKRAKTPINENNVQVVLQKNEQYWDTFLSKVPHPENFELTSVKTYGVTSEQIRQAYYKAWVFTAQNVLPEDNEVYPYPQICTGKPSLWDEGEAHAPFSAAWESFLGIQFYAFIDPDLSWKAYKGLMSLVDKDGMLGGESLPSRKAQTALILYEMTKDKKSLEEVYPAIKRYLDWRLNITHWVYGDIKPTTNFKDAEFAFSALIDIQYLLKIAAILGHKKDIPVWEKKFDEFGKQSLTWFWETPQSFPIQNYWVDTQKRENRNTIWITTCLHIKNYLKGDYLTSTIKKFDKDYNPDLSFANFLMPKYPDVSYSVYGLIEHGYTDRALGTIEACLRDIARGHTAFAEQYIGDDFKADGVRPSLFGSSIIIDFVLLKNGYMFGDGNPKAISLPNNGGGVTDINIDGKMYDLEVIPESKKILFGQKERLRSIKLTKKIIDLK